MLDQEILKIAAEGRKFNVGLCVLCKDHSELDHKLLSQCVQILPLSKDKCLMTTYPLFSRR